jgi:hypothetical protein
MKKVIAAGLWKDSDPPKDGNWILALYSGVPVVIRFIEGINRWEIEGSKGHYYTDDPDYWAMIYPPVELKNG